MSDTTFGLDSIGQISVPVHDLQQATAFYRDTLGMRHLFAAPGMAFFDCDGIRLVLAVPERPEFDHPSSIIYFKVSSIQAAYAVLHERGVQFVDQPHVVANMDSYDLWMTGFRDSEGNYLCLMSEVAHI